MNPRSLALAFATTVLIIASCGREDRKPQRAVNPPDSLIYRRTDVPFTPRFDMPSPSTMQAARSMDEIERLMENGLHEQARKQLDVYLAEGGDHPRAFYLRGRNDYMHGDWALAAPWFEKAVDRSPSYLEPRVMLAYCFLKLERFVAAEGVFAEIDRLLPKAPWGPYGMGIVAHQRGDNARATKLLDDALGRDPRHVPALRVRAELARIANDPMLEQRLLLRHIAEEPTASAFARLGEIAAANQRPQDARRHYERSYDLEADHGTARRLAELATQRGDSAESRRWQQLAGITPQPAAAKGKPGQQ